MKKSVPSYYPIFLNVSARKCVVVGGGEVALRKVKTLLALGAEITVIAPELCGGLAGLAEAKTIDVLNRDYQAGDLQDAFLVIVATDQPDVNRRAAKDAIEAGVLVNVVDSAPDSNFIVPSCLHRGDVTIAISTSGRSPALARKLRTRLEEQFGPEYGELAILIDEVRAGVKERGMKISGDRWQDALELDAILDLLRKGEREKARAFLLDRLIACTEATDAT